jgi:hypothetical protein
MQELPFFGPAPTVNPFSSAPTEPSIFESYPDDELGISVRLSACTQTRVSELSVEKELLNISLNLLLRLFHNQVSDFLVFAEECRDDWQPDLPVVLQCWFRTKNRFRFTSNSDRVDFENGTLLRNFEETITYPVAATREIVLH